ncbi:hypothetical protein ACNKHR_03295 [Shigella flexneri]
MTGASPLSRPQRADQPSATQPLMHQKIKKHPTPRKIYADKLEQEKVATLEDATEKVDLYPDALDAGDCVVAEWCPMNMYSSPGRRTSTTNGTKRPDKLR